MTKINHDSNLPRILEIIKEKSYHKEKVTLSSGIESDHYFDLKPTMLDPEGAWLLANEIFKIVAHRCDYICGVESGSIPLVSCVSMLSNGVSFSSIPALFVRKDVKDHGTQKLIEGIVDGEKLLGSRVILIEDVITTGMSVLKSAWALEAFGANAIEIIAVIDREEGAYEKLNNFGIRLTSLFTSDTLR